MLRAALLFFAFIVAFASLCGCASGSRSRDGNASSPEDFAFGIIVPAGLASSQPTPHDQRVGRLLEPACYLLASDGTLRAAFGRVDPDYRLPPIVRRVSRDQREELYQSLHASGLLAPNAAGQQVGDAAEAIGTFSERSSPQPVAAGTGMIGVWWTAAGRRRSFTILPVQVPDASATGPSEANNLSAAKAWMSVESALHTLRRWSWRDAGPTPLVPPEFSATPSEASP